MTSLLIARLTLTQSCSVRSSATTARKKNRGTKSLATKATRTVSWLPRTTKDSACLATYSTSSSTCCTRPGLKWQPNLNVWKMPSERLACCHRNANLETMATFGSFRSNLHSRTVLTPWLSLLLPSPRLPTTAIGACFTSSDSTPPSILTLPQFWWVASFWTNLVCILSTTTTNKSVSWLWILLSTKWLIQKSIRPQKRLLLKILTLAFYTCHHTRKSLMSQSPSRCK